MESKIDQMMIKLSDIKTSLFDIFTEIQLTRSKLQKLLSDHSNNMNKSKDFIPLAPPATNTTSLMRGGVKKQKKVASSKQTLAASNGNNKKKARDPQFTDAMQNVLFRFSTLVQVAIGELICNSITVLYDIICVDSKGEEGNGGVQNKREDSNVTSSNTVLLQLELMLYIPKLVLVPNIRDIYDIVIELLLMIAGLFNGVDMWGLERREEEMEEEGESLLESNNEKVVDTVHDIKQKLKNYFEGILIVKQCCYFIITNVFVKAYCMYCMSVCRCTACTCTLFIHINLHYVRMHVQVHASHIVCSSYFIFNVFYLIITKVYVHSF